jgi:hypothetical protein
MPDPKSILSASRLPKLAIAFLTVSAVAASVAAKPAFDSLLYNPHWYRSYDSSDRIIPAEGSLIHAWRFSDAERRPDSFFVGIDTLWGLPQDMDGDTASDWDLQVCPDEICMNGLKAGIHGAVGAYPFEDGHFETEHHFQFFPAIDKAFNFTAPAHSLFGAMMFCRSLTTGQADTVFAFGAWELAWDTAAAPPVRPVAGYLPKLSDFAIRGDTVRYLKAGAGVHRQAGRIGIDRPGLTAVAQGRGLRICLAGAPAGAEVFMLGLDGRMLWRSGPLAPRQTEIIWPGESASPTGTRIAVLRAVWQGGSSQIRILRIAP